MICTTSYVASYSSFSRTYWYICKTSRSGISMDKGSAAATNSSVDGMKDLCSGCACWVEDGWSYCMQCGTERTRPRRPSLTLSYSSSSIKDVYQNKGVPRLKQVSTPPKERGKRKLLRRRQSSDKVRHQLQQVRSVHCSHILLYDAVRRMTPFVEACYLIIDFDIIPTHAILCVVRRYHR